MSWLSKAIGDLTGKNESKKQANLNRKDVAKRLKLAREAVSTDNLMQMTGLLFPGLFPGTAGAGWSLTRSGGGASANRVSGGGIQSAEQSSIPALRHASRLPFTLSMVASDGEFAPSPDDPANFGRAGGYDPFPTAGSTQGAVTQEFIAAQRANNPDYQLPMVPWEARGQAQPWGETPAKEKTQRKSGSKSRDAFFGTNQGLDATISRWANMRSNVGRWEERNPFWSSLIYSLMDRVIHGSGRAADWFGKSVSGRAQGGPVEAGEPVMVGEEGPEMVVPEGGAGEAPMPPEAMQGGPPAEAEPVEFDEQTLAMVIQLLIQILQQGQAGGMEGMEAPGEMEGGMGMPGEGEGMANMGGGMPGMPGLPIAPESGPMMGAGPPEPRAWGGMVQSGQPYLVGEQGPELLVPRKSGTVIPNPQTKIPANPTPMPGVGTMAGTESSGGIQPVTFPTPLATTEPNASATPATPAYSSPGEAIVSRMLDFLTNPGRTSTAGYERGQEQANRVERRMMDVASGGAAGAGISGASPAVKALQMAAVGVGGQLRGKAAQDQAALEESNYRTDITTGADMYEQAFNQLMKYMGLQVSAITGTPVASNYPTSVGGSDVIALIGDILSAIEYME